jgi:hypothetical protein
VKGENQWPLLKRIRPGRDLLHTLSVNSEYDLAALIQFFISSDLPDSFGIDSTVGKVCYSYVDVGMA